MRAIKWLNDSKRELLKLPTDVIQEVGYALYLGQKGDHYVKTKPFKGCGSGVYEIAIAYDTNAYRVVYIVNLSDALYVLHCFKKKSKFWIKTPTEEINVIKQRLKLLKLNER